MTELLNGMDLWTRLKTKRAEIVNALLLDIMEAIQKGFNDNRHTVQWEFTRSECETGIMEAVLKTLREQQFLYSTSYNNDPDKGRFLYDISWDHSTMKDN